MRRNLLRAFAFAAAFALTSLALAAPSGWTFQGCWTQSSSGPCYDVYSDASGNYWRCASCGTTKNFNHCVQINPATGLWCS